MSLDLYIRSHHPVKHRGTGVFVRDNGQTRELNTIEEVKAHFPDADTSDIDIREWEDDGTLPLQHDAQPHGNGKPCAD